MNVFFAGDDIVDEYINDIMELLDYMDAIDRIEITPPPPPPPLVRQHAGPLAVEVVDLTCGEDIDYDDIPIATRLDFSLAVDELDNGGYFGAPRAHCR